MKRDMELIRMVLLHEEDPAQVDISGQSKDRVLYHTGLAIEAGLVKGSAIVDGQGVLRSAYTWGLTWSGHDFLDAARNEGPWKKAMATAKEKGVSLTMDVLTELLKKGLKDLVGLP